MKDRLMLEDYCEEIKKCLKCNEILAIIKINPFEDNITCNKKIADRNFKNNYIQIDPTPNLIINNIEMSVNRDKFNDPVVYTIINCKCIKCNEKQTITYSDKDIYQDY